MRPRCITVGGSILVEPLPPPGVDVALGSDLQDGIATVKMYAVGSLLISEWSAFIIYSPQLINPKFNLTYPPTRIPVDEATTAIQIALLYFSFECSACNFWLEFNG
jgi:hypothetical protein